MGLRAYILDFGGQHTGLPVPFTGITEDRDLILDYVEPKAIRAYAHRSLVTDSDDPFPFWHPDLILRDPQHIDMMNTTRRHLGQKR